MSKCILIVDDEKTIRWSLSEALKDSDYIVFDTDTGAKAVKLYKEHLPDLVLLDLKLSNENGLEILQNMKEIDSSTPVIIMTAYGEIETAVEAMRKGAYDFVLKPFSLEKLKVTIKNAVEAQRLRSEIRYLKGRTSGKNVFKDFIGQSGALQKIFTKIKKIGESQANTILITGESGSGKELVARAIHACSYKEPRPFMEINCASVPETLLESELFGYEKGAFTDAKARKKGLVELAEGGTLFLDEIGEMGITLQGRLLRVLENKTFRRVGGVQDLKVNTRIISATNRDLEKAIKEKTFRSDLYYRLKVIPVFIPPLRDRREDIPLLVNHFIEKFNKELHKQVKPAGNELLDALLTYNWPGNIRELKNVIERAMLLDAEEEILVDHIPGEIIYLGEAHQEVPKSAKVAESFYPMTLKQVEKIQIERTLVQTGGNKSKAAIILGISRQTLREKLKSFDESNRSEK